MSERPEEQDIRLWIEGEERVDPWVVGSLVTWSGTPPAFVWLGYVSERRECLTSGAWTVTKIYAMYSTSGDVCYIGGATIDVLDRFDQV